jgi:hypothetical protein
MGTLSWDWAKQPVEVPVYGNQFKDRVVSLYTQFLWAPKEKQCPFCAEGKGNPARVTIPDGPELPEKVEEDEYQDIKDALDSHEKSVIRAHTAHTDEYVDGITAHTDEYVDGTICEACHHPLPLVSGKQTHAIPCTCGKQVCLHCYDLHKNCGCEVVSVLGVVTQNPDIGMVEEPINELRELATLHPEEAFRVADDIEGADYELEIDQGQVVRTVRLHAIENEAMIGLTTEPSQTIDHAQDWYPQDGILGASPIKRAGRKHTKSGALARARPKHAPTAIGTTRRRLANDASWAYQPRQR